MKKIIFILSSLFSFAALRAQEPADALRYAWYAPGSSARIQAVGGAMGSLGGDISASFVNPAGLAFYKTGDFVLSPSYRFGRTKSTYFGRTESRNSDKFSWGSTGFVVGTGNNNTRNVRNTSFSIAYNRTADFNSDIFYRGQNNQSSYSQKFLDEIRNNNVKDGNALSGNYPFGSSLAFNTYWIDTVGGGTNGNFQFQSRSAALLASGLLQQNSIHSTGGIDEMALGVAVNLRDKLMVGGSIGVPYLHYRRDAEFVEADATSNPNNHFNYAMVNETLRTSGLGINLRAGLIYKPTEYWRLGLALHSPTFYTLTDRYETSITADVEKGNVLSDYSNDYTDGAPSRFRYTYATPYRAIASVSYVLREVQDVRKQKGFLTADVEYVNYKASSFSAASNEDGSGTSEADRAYLKQLNRSIDAAYKSTFNVRAGGELKFTTVMVRLGAAYYGNPYKNLNGEKGSKLNLSGGLGYRDKGFFIDLTYVYSLNKDVNYAYRLSSAPYSGAQVKNTASNIFLTFGVKI